MILDHPVFKSLKSFGLYMLIWILVMGIHFAVLSTVYQMNYINAVIDSLVFNLLLAFFGLVLWFAVGFSKPDKANLFHVIFNHLITLYGT